MKIQALVTVLLSAALLAPPAAWARRNLEEEPEMYYGYEGVPQKIVLSNKKFGVRFKPNVSRGRMSQALANVPEIEPPVSEQLDALEQGHTTLVELVKSNRGKGRCRNVRARLRQLGDVQEVRPVYVIRPGIEELETEYLYASVPSSASVDEIVAVLADLDLEIVKDVDYSVIGKIGLRLRVPVRGRRRSTVAIANALHEHPLVLQAAPVFNHLYPTECSLLHPDDPLYGVSPYAADKNRQYDLYNNGATGHMNMPGAWDVLYDGNGDLKSGFNGDVVIACLDNGVMLDYENQAGIPVGHLCPDCDCVDEYSVTQDGHPDLEANQWRNETEINGTSGIDDDNNGYIDDYFGWNFVDGGTREKWPYPTKNRQGYHGTAAMSVAAAVSDNNTGMAGVCWHAEIMPVKFTKLWISLWTGGDALYDMHMADAINYAAGLGQTSTHADVLSLLSSVNTYSPEDHDAIRAARAKGRVIVSPAANSNLNIGSLDSYFRSFPAVLPEVICVGATNRYDRRCSALDWNYDENAGSSRGSNYGWPLDLMAPSCTGRMVYTPSDLSTSPVTKGSDVWGPWSANFPGVTGDLSGYLYFGGGGGTSTAFPHISGLSALLLGIDGSFSPADIQSIMQWSAKDLDYNFYEMYYFDDDFPDLNGDYCYTSYYINDDDEQVSDEVEVITTYTAGAGRDEETGWGLADGAAAVEWAMRPRFTVKSGGKNVLSIDDQGYVAMDGRIVTQASSAQLTPVAGVEEFIVRDSSNNVLARLDTSWGDCSDNEGFFDKDFWPTLYLKGCLYQKNTLAPSVSCFKIKDSAGNLVAYITGAADGSIPAGSFVVKGAVFMAADPDPQAYQTSPVFSDSFSTWSDPELWSTDYYSSQPSWSVTAGNWQIADPGTSTLANNGTGSAQNPYDEVLISLGDAPATAGTLTGDLHVDFLFNNYDCTTTFTVLDDGGSGDDVSLSITPRESTECVKDGEFVLDDAWTVGTGWVVDEQGEATATDATTNLQQITGDMATSLVSDTAYHVRFEISDYQGSGTVTPILRSAQGTAVSGDPDKPVTVEQVITASGTDNGFVLDANSNFTGKIDKVSVVPAMVGNGDFGSFTGWSGQNWSCAGGEAVASAATASLQQTSGNMPITLDAGVSYKVRFTVTDYTGGTIRPVLRSASGTYVNEEGTFEQVIVASGTDNGFQLEPGSAFTGHVDNVSIVPVSLIELTGSDITPTVAALEYCVDSCGTWLQPVSTGAWYELRLQVTYNPDATSGSGGVVRAWVRQRDEANLLWCEAVEYKDQAGFDGVTYDEDYLAFTVDHDADGVYTDSRWKFDNVLTYMLERGSFYNLDAPLTGGDRCWGGCDDEEECGSAPAAGKAKFSFAAILPAGTGLVLLTVAWCFRAAGRYRRKMRA